MSQQFGYGASGSSPPDSFICDERLSALSVGILARMLADPSYPRTIKGIAARGHEGQVAVGKARKLLKQYGYVVDEKTRGPHGTVYTVTKVSPEPHSPSFGEPSSGELSFGEHRDHESVPPVPTRDDDASSQVAPRPRFRTFDEVRDHESRVSAATSNDDEDGQVSTGTTISGSHLLVDSSTASNCDLDMAFGPISEQDQVQGDSSTTHTAPSKRMEPRNQGSGDHRPREATPRPEGWDGSCWPNDGHERGDPIHSRGLRQYHRWRDARRVSA